MGIVNVSGFCLFIAVFANDCFSNSISQSIVNGWHPLSRRRERVRVRAVELKTVLIQPTTPHPHPLHPQEVCRWVPRCYAATLPQSRLREKGVNSSIEIELEKQG
jgi:hypothetical protein